MRNWYVFLKYVFEAQFKFGASRQSQSPIRICTAGFAHARVAFAGWHHWREHRIRSRSTSALDPRSLRPRNGCYNIVMRDCRTSRVVTRWCVCSGQCRAARTGRKRIAKGEGGSPRGNLAHREGGATVHIFAAFAPLMASVPLAICSYRWSPGIPGASLRVFPSPVFARLHRHVVTRGYTQVQTYTPLEYRKSFALCRPRWDTRGTKCTNPVSDANAFRETNRNLRFWAPNFVPLNFRCYRTDRVWC